ncbi:MAG: DNA cytosine methyltransferase [Methanobacteriota archaeon]
MLVLIGCEESQVVCKAFRDAGHEAYSCDLQPTRGNPDWHIQNDIMQVIPTRRWALIILHPDCTAMALSGNRWYGKGMPRHNERIEAVTWTVELWELAKRHSDKVVLENPTSVIFKHLNSTTVQYIQPYDHGHGETKKTGLALHNVEPLQPTNTVEGREHRVWKMAPSPTRKRDRSRTLDGVAAAMATQWS